MIEVDVIATPAGPVTVEVEAGQIVRVHLGRRVRRGARRKRLTSIRRLLAAWFQGRAVKAPLKLEGTEFTLRVYEVVRSIPPGETLTYGEVARGAGRPGAARAVGSVMANNRHPLFIPCHRVVASTGLGGFSSPGGLDQKRILLELERHR